MQTPFDDADIATEEKEEDDDEDNDEGASAYSTCLFSPTTFSFRSFPSSSVHTPLAFLLYLSSIECDTCRRGPKSGERRRKWRRFHPSTRRIAIRVSRRSYSSRERTE